jgi:uncharacterized protein
MNSSQIKMVIAPGSGQLSAPGWKLVETHISYVLLGPSYAYKIKKNIKYSFLDFSTLKKRKHFCEREVLLNNRLTSGVYLAVVPIRKQKSGLKIEGTSGDIIDYAIKMKRLQESKQMHLMLLNKTVTIAHVEALANTIRKFHDKTTVVKRNFNPAAFAEQFNDINSVKDIIISSLSPLHGKLIDKAVSLSNKFLDHYEEVFKQRVENGFVKDCHGDLHSRNIFLYRNPVIFDCIEFNDAFRHIDVLDELAFFCMDLEADGFHQLSNSFLHFYFSKSNDTFGKTERLLFTYYKCYRANVRAKVNALRAMQPGEQLKNQKFEEANKYIELMRTYMKELTW